MNSDDAALQRRDEPVVEAAVPPRPAPSVFELWPNMPFTLTRGRFSIGWQDWPENKGGLGFVIARRSALGYKVITRYPFTDEGWVEAWREAITLDPGLAEQVRSVIAKRAETDDAARKLQEFRASTLAYLRNVVYLGGFLPAADLTAGQPYDVRFLEDRIAVFKGTPQYGVNPQLVPPLGEVPYAEVVAVDVGGPGLTKTGGGFIGGGFGVAGAAEGMAIAGVLNALTTRVKIKTVIRVEAANAELFFLHTMIEPEALRIELSRALGVIRQAKSEPVQQPPSRTPGERLAEITRLHSEGLLTDEEYQAKRAEIISQL